MRFFDAHCHLHLKSALDTPQLNLEAGNTYRFALMATHPSEWSQLKRIIDKQPAQTFLAGFGLHPWHAHQLADTERSHWWSELALEAMVNSVPHSFIGEFGLDYASRIPADIVTPLDDETQRRLQLQIFNTQFDLACRMGKPVSLHLVRCHGFFFEFVRDRLKRLKQATVDELFPPAIMLHSYSGSADIIRSLLRLGSGVGSRFYFSFSTTVNGRSMHRLEQCIEASPNDRLLIESDVEDLVHVETSLRDIVEIVARVKAWSTEEAADTTWDNAERFFAHAL